MSSGLVNSRSRIGRGSGLRILYLMRLRMEMVLTLILMTTFGAVPLLDMLVVVIIVRAAIDREHIMGHMLGLILS
jgi:hypothetical protein